MPGSIHLNAEVVDQYRSRQVLGWTELMRKARLSGKICTKIRQGGAVSPRTIRKLAGALGVEAGTLVQIRNDGGNKAAVMAASA